MTSTPRLRSAGSLIRRISSERSPRSSSFRRGAAAPNSAPRRAAAMHGSGYSAALIAELLVELKAAGHYDSHPCRGGRGRAAGLTAPRSRACAVAEAT